MGAAIPISDVEVLLKETAAEDILPYYQRLSDSDVEEKSPGDLVTVADQAAELRLAERLPGLLPGSIVVGEEMTYADESILDRLQGDAPVWVIDPLDGTGNFAAGERIFAIMVSLMHRGETCAGWIFDPLGDRMAVAEQGGGCRLNGLPVHIAPAPDDPAMMQGGLATKFLPEDLRTGVEAASSKFARTWTTMCAGHEYLSLLSGEKHFKLFYRTLPWDHAAGSLMYREAGGYACRFDGSVYHPADGGKGLLLATDPDTWRRVHDILIPGVMAGRTK
ncbi:MAG: inositol monophosphatase [Rhodospirillales bacterium]|nr:inositol monophosphatase [Rhodospirillales bacterium]